MHKVVPGIIAVAASVVIAGTALGQQAPKIDDPLAQYPLRAVDGNSMLVWTYVGGNTSDATNGDIFLERSAYADSGKTDIVSNLALDWLLCDTEGTIHLGMGQPNHLNVWLTQDDLFNLGSVFSDVPNFDVTQLVGSGDANGPTDASGNAALDPAAQSIAKTVFQNLTAVYSGYHKCGG
jgi:hypothetical protein